MADYNLGKARGEVVIDFDGKGTDEAAKGIDNVGGAALRFAKVAAGVTVGLAALVAGVALKGGIERALNIQDAQAKLKGLGHDTESITTIMNSALDSVRGTAFGLDEAATVAATAVAAGIQPGQELTKYLTLTADAASIAGVSISEMGAILNKTTTSGKVMTDDLNQLADRGLPIFTWLQEAYGVTGAELSKMVSAGEVDAATFRRVIEENIGGAALSSGDTARGAFANVQAALSRVGAAFISGAITSAPQLFQSIAGAIDRFGTAIAPASGQLNALISNGMVRLAEWIDRIDFEAVIAGVMRFIEQIRAGDFSAFGSQFNAVITAARPLMPLLLELGQGLGSISGSIGEVIAAGMPVLGVALQALADILNFLGDRPKLLAAALIAIGVAAAASQGSQVAANAALVAGIPLKIAAIAADVARTLALRASTAATLQGMAAENSSTASRVLATGVINNQTLGLTRQALATKAAAAATKIAAAAQWVMNAALSANPIGIIILAIAALVAGLVWFFTQTELGQSIWSGFVSFLTGAWEGLVSVATTAFGAIGDFLAGVWDGIVSGVTTAFNFVKDLFLNFTVMGLIIQNFGPISAFIQGIFDAVAGFVQSAIDKVVAIFTFFSGIVQTVFAGITAFMQPFVDWFATYMVPLIQAAVGLVMAILQYLWSAVVMGFQLLLAGITVVLTAIGSFITGIWNGIVAFVTAVVGAIVAYVVGQWNQMLAVVSAVMSAISGFVSSVWNTILGFITAVVANIVNFVRSVWNTLVSIISGPLNSALGVVNSIWSSIKSAISTAVNAVINTIRTVFNTASSVVSSAFSGIVGAVRGPFDQAVSIISGIKDKVIGIFSNAGSWLLDAGKNIIRGLIDGINNMIKGLTDKLNFITDLIPENKGPEKVDKVLLLENGEMIMQSLINGIVNKTPSLQGALGNITDSIPEYASTSLGTSGGATAPTGGSYTHNQTFNIHTDENPTLWARAVGREYDDADTGMGR